MLVVIFILLLLYLYLSMFFILLLFFSLLFEIIPPPSMAIAGVFTPHFILSGQPIAECFATLSFVQPFRSASSATDLSGHFLPTGVFYLTLHPEIFGTVCFY